VDWYTTTAFGIQILSYGDSGKVRDSLAADEVFGGDGRLA